MNELKTIDGDLAIENNSLVIITGIDEVRQRAEQRLKLFKGEWFLNITEGLPWYTDIFIKGQNQGVIEALIKRQIVNTPGVKELTKFKMVVDNSTRAATITAEFLGYDGDIGLLEVEI